ncbi:flagellar biosynthesis anti-sigma factor FlgM [Sphingomonas sp. Leaf21]|uniref:flagellar biosynthesis anti-sigma factor FlgM n=1 Tax=Sphingomonas sp. Leaf21 TaxID=2876550 RepID=UPI001E3C8EB6|nr:flagellar biosynthesis anti-sigma factor FlgM [Sphingomonas sp. Leaf21]
MVEITTSRLNAGDTRVARIAPSRVAATPEAGPAPAKLTPGDTSALSGLSAAMASQPPVNAERIAQIKRAIAEGNFPILPATIADQMIALKLSWNNNDAA